MSKRPNRSEADRIDDSAPSSTDIDGWTDGRRYADPRQDADIKPIHRLIALA
jgi:hypothetical protein